jgi:hypothetical protein
MPWLREIPPGSKPNGCRIARKGERGRMICSQVRDSAPFRHDFELQPSRMINITLWAIGTLSQIARIAANNAIAEHQDPEMSVGLDIAV